MNLNVLIKFLPGFSNTELERSITIPAYFIFFPLKKLPGSESK